MKLCSTCKEYKSLSSYNTSKQTLDGYGYICKKCVSVYNKKYLANHKNIRKQYDKQYYSNNIDKHKIYIEEYIEQNKEKIRLYQKQYDEDNNEKKKEYIKQYYVNNKEEKKSYAKSYRKNNMTKIREYTKQYDKTHREEKNIYQNTRRSNSLDLQLKDNISTYLNKTINKKMTTNKYLKLFGYNLDNLKNHLENQFKPGMTWDNYGRKKGIRCWEIDHIKPVSLFNFTEDECIIECWSLNNLQPLWDDENRRKSNKYKEK